MSYEAALRWGKGSPLSDGRHEEAADITCNARIAADYLGGSVFNTRAPSIGNPKRFRREL